MRRGLILAAVLAPGLAFAQSDDPGLLTRFLQNNLSDAGREVTITGFQGALSSRAKIAQLTIADGQGVWLTMNGLTLDWNRAALLRGRLSVNELSAEEVILARPPLRDPGLPSPEAPGFSLPELPVSVDIGKVSVARAEIGAGVLGQKVEATLEASLQLSGGEGQTKLSLIRLDDGPSGQVTLEAGYANATRLLSLNLDAREGAGGIAATRLGLPGAPETRLQITGQGIIDDFGADIRLATDGADRLAGRVTLTTAGGDRAFTATLGGDPAPLFLPQYAAFFGNDVQLDVAGSRAASGGLELTKLSVRTSALTLDGTLRTGADGLPDRFALTGRIAAADGGPVLLPVSAGETRIDAAEVDLNYDATTDQGWTGRASVLGLQRAGLAVERMLLSGSGRIRGGGSATLSLIAAGVKPADPALAQAVGEAVTGRADLAWDKGQPLQVTNLTLAGSDYTLRANGALSGLASGFGLQGRLEAELADLTRFAGLAGRPLGGAARLTADGKGSLLGGDFDLTGELQGEGLRVGQPQANALLAASSRIVFSLARGKEGTEIRQLDLTASTLSVAVAGWLRSAGSDLTADLRFDDLSRLGGGYRGALTGQARVTGTAQAAALTLEAKADGLAIGQAEADRLLRGQSTVSAALRLEEGALRIDRLALANPQLSATVKGRGPEAGRVVDVAAKLADLGLLLPDFPGPVTVTGVATGQPGGHRLDVRATGPGSIDARVSGLLATAGAQNDLALVGTAQAALANPLIQPRTVGGPLRFDLRLQGPLAADSVSGRVTLAEGRIAAPFLRLALQQVKAEAVLARGSATVSADAAATAGGRIGLRGTVALRPPFQADLTVTPREMVLRDPEFYETRANGEIRITGPLTGGARIAGTITLPETEIRVPSTNIGRAGAIPDLTHRNEPAAVNATRARAGLTGQAERARPSRPFALDLLINAPSRVFLRGRGLDAELGGSLRLGGTTAAVVPSGGIDLIRGRLDILGRRLDLSEAQLRIQGSLDPYLRVVASNASGGITSSVVIEGRISQPEITFTSSPPLPEDEVLAHLLFDRDLSGLSPFQALQLANAVATLAGRGGDGLIGSLRRGFGLDDLDLGAEGGGGLRLGRYIAKNIYTDVTVGSDGTTKLNLNLDLRPGVTARGSASSDGNTGFGVFVERDY